MTDELLISIWRAESRLTCDEHKIFNIEKAKTKDRNSITKLAYNKVKVKIQPKLRTLQRVYCDTLVVLDREYYRAHQCLPTKSPFVVHFCTILTIVCQVKKKIDYCIKSV